MAWSSHQWRHFQAFSLGSSVGDGDDLFFFTVQYVMRFCRIIKVSLGNSGSVSHTAYSAQSLFDSWACCLGPPSRRLQKSFGWCMLFSSNAVHHKVWCCPNPDGFCDCHTLLLYFFSNLNTFQLSHLSAFDIRKFATRDFSPGIFSLINFFPHRSILLGSSSGDFVLKSLGRQSTFWSTMATTTSSAFPLATEDPYTGGQDASAGSANSGGAVDDAAGASGGTSGAVELSHGALVAIIVVVVVVAIGGSKFPPTHQNRLAVQEKLTRAPQSRPPFFSTWPRRRSGRSGRTSAARPRRS